MFLAGLISNIRECFIPFSGYEVMNKKDDDVIQTLTEQWIAKYPVLADYEKKRDAEINRIAKDIFQDLRSIPIGDSNADMIINHLVNIAKGSHRLKGAMVLQVDNLTYQHKDLNNRLYRKLSFVYTPKF